jgi:hypothetical protein
MTTIPTETHTAQFVRLKLTDAERANPHLRRARERDAVAHGWFASPDEASAFFDSQSDEETTAELRAAFAQGERLLAQVDKQADRTREAWGRQQRLNGLRDRRDRLARALAVERGKLGFIDASLAGAKENYGVFLGRDMQPAAFVGFGLDLLGLAATAKFIRDEIIPKLEADAAAAELALKTFAAASPPS